jgi:hypothetical protein
VNYQVAIGERQPLPALEEHPDGHKDPERLASLQRDLDRVQTLKRTSRAHEYYTAVDSTGEYKRSPVKRSIWAELLDTLWAFRVEPAQVKITLSIDGNLENEIFVSERTSMEDLRKIVLNHFMGRCRVQPNEFPLNDWTEVLVIPSFLPLTSLDSAMNVLVPYMIHGEH